MEVYQEAWTALPQVKILVGFKMRRDAAAETLIPRGGAPRREKGAQGRQARADGRRLRTAPRGPRDLSF